MEFACSLRKKQIMIRYLLIFSLLLTTIFVKAAQTDTSAYNIQRLKINKLLSDRSIKFGQYDQSLHTRTGIFGLQTKKDIRKSNEILRQIALNDNDIFKEIKVLLDYKDLEVAQTKTEINTSSSRAQNYMLSIKKLQDQHEQLKLDVATAEKSKNFSRLVIVILTVTVIGLVIYIFKLKR
jgi:hypothetical protein